MTAAEISCGKGHAVVPMISPTVRELLQTQINECFEFLFTLQKMPIYSVA